MPAGTVYVGRGSRWGNPYLFKKTGAGYTFFEQTETGLEPLERFGLVSTVREARGVVVEAYKRALMESAPHLAAIRGKNLACWCPLDDPCHADVLLELANNG